MRILYLGDIMGEFGQRVVAARLAKIRRDYGIDLVIAQSENVTEGRGMSVADYQGLRKSGVDVCTGGNWTLHRDELHSLLADPNSPVLRPANYPAGTPGLGHKLVTVRGKQVLIVSLLGNIVGKDADRPTDNPLLIIDALLEQYATTPLAAIVVNLHGDFSSEKVVIGHYLDGRASIVVGDHWHVPTADARILPAGTAHMTDVGMCGALNASLGVVLESVVPRWRDGKITRNVLAESGAWQLSGLLVDVDDATGKATSVEHLYFTGDTL